MSINSYLSELNSVKEELRRIKEHNKRLTDKKKILEENIQNWFIKNNQTSIKYNGKIISINETTTSKRKKKVEKMEDFDNVLKKYGLHNTKKVINELLDANKGNKIHTTKLNFDNKK